MKQSSPLEVSGNTFTFPSSRETPATTITDSDVSLAGEARKFEERPQHGELTDDSFIQSDGGCSHDG